MTPLELAGTALISTICSLLMLLATKLVNRRGDRARDDKAELEAEVSRLSYVQALELRVAGLETRVEQLERERDAERAQVRALKQLWRSTIKWAIELRDQVIALGGDAPAMPSDVEQALTTLDQAE